MEWAKRLYRMDLYILANLEKVNGMVKVCIFVQMDLNTKEHSFITRCTGKASINGKMVESIEVVTKVTHYMDLVSTLGLMVENILATIIMI